MSNKTKIEKVREQRRLMRKKEILLEKNRLGLNQLLKPALYLFLSIILELVTFALFDFKTASGSKQVLPQYIFFDIGIWLFVCGLLLCSKKNWVSNLIFYISIIIKVTLFIVGVTLKGDFGYLFTLDKARLIPEMLESMNTTFINYWLIAVAVLGSVFVIALPIVFDKILGRKKIQLKRISNSIFCLLLFLITSTVGAGCFAAQTALMKTSSAHKEISDDKYLYQNLHINDLSFQKFGSCGFYIKNFINLIFPNNGVSKSEETSTIETYNKSVAGRDVTASLYGDNLIMIMLESFEWFAIDPYNTPNLWALKTGESSDYVDDQALVFENYYSNNKTNVSEDIGLLGYMPNEAMFSVKSANSYATKFSLPNLFKNEGYSTTYLHNWKIKFYNRNEVNKNIGFDKIYSLEDFQSDSKSTKFNFYNLESEFIDQFMDEIAPTDRKFMSFYTTVSSHGSYAIQNPKFEKHFNTYDKNLSKMKTWFTNNGYTFPEDEEFQAYLKEYKSSVMDTDEMIGKLFDHLNKTGLINNTAVLLYSDHNAYYQNLSKNIKGTQDHNFSSQKAYTVPMMLYSKKVSRSRIVRDFCSTYDIYPTLGEMFGLPYNKINAQGKDILSADIANTVYSSALTGFYNSKCHSKNMQYITKYEGSTNTDVETFKTNVCEFLSKQKTLNIVYKSGKTYK